MSGMTREQKERIAEAYRVKAMRELLPFIMWTKPGYLAGWFQQVVCEAIDEFLEDVLAHRSPRLMLFAPPRHGKSEIVSRSMPAFAFGKNPDLSIIATSYSNDLASTMNRDVQRRIDTPEYHQLFPETTLSRSSVRTVTAAGAFMRNSDTFEIVDRTGLYKSAGVQTGISGRGFDIGIIDDPVKDAQEAGSQTVRDSVWAWYLSTFFTRCMPGAGILLIMTRWHSDDLAGRLLAQMERGGEKWKVMRFPAIAETNEQYRKKGEPLHPERYDLKALNSIRRGTSDAAGAKAGVGSQVWASLYQQRPSLAEGNIFKEGNWKYLRAPMPPSQMGFKERRHYFHELGITRVIQRWDTALGAKKQADFSACVTLGIAPSRFYVLDVWKRQIEFPEVKRQVQLLYDKWLPAKVYIEGGGSASGKATVQAMRRDARVPLYETTTAIDKVLRANAVSPQQESGLVYLFEGEDWTADFVQMCSAFPNIPHDDDVDAFIGALEEAVGRRGPMNIPDVLLRSEGVAI